MKKKGTKTDIDELKNQLARALADYDNLQKRIEKEREILKFVAGASLTRRLLPVFDMLNDCQNHLNDSGLAITINEFIGALKEEGIKRIDAAPGTEFNTIVHEAVEVVDGEEGKVIEEVMSGWEYGDGTVIRPAKVKVGKKQVKEENK